MSLTKLTEIPSSGKVPGKPMPPSIINECFENTYINDNNIQPKSLVYRLIKDFKVYPALAYHGFRVAFAKLTTINFSDDKHQIELDAN